jgi:thioredoxin 1
MSHVFTDSNFEAEVLKNESVVLVDFWAPWCGPCRKMAPILDELAEDLKDEAVKIGKLNVDENQVTPGNYGIMSIPTLIIFKGGQPVEQLVGLRPKAELADKLKDLAG